MYTRALMTYLSGGYLPCRKDDKVVNKSILIHPISNYIFLGELF